MTWLLPTLILSFGDVAVAAPPLPTPVFVLAQTNVPGGKTKPPAKSTVKPAASDANGDGDGKSDSSDEDSSSEGGDEKKKKGGSGDFMTSLLIMGGIFLFFWLVFIRPQSKQIKEHKKLVEALKVGDPIVTQGGMFGRIVGFDDANNAVNLEISKGVRVRILRAQVARHQGSTDGKKDNESKASKP